MKSLSFAISLLTVLVIPLNASLITFESGAGPGGEFLNLNPSNPYTEARFTFTPLNSASALIGPSGPPYPSLFPGDDTTFLGFDSINNITLTGPAPFSLDSALVGPITYPYGNGPLDLTVVGNVLGGGTLSATFYNLTTATEEFIGFKNLQSATFSGTYSAGLDDIYTNGTVPEPASWLLVGATLWLGGLVFIISKGELWFKPDLRK